jgi:hypothetical protein
MRQVAVAGDAHSVMVAVDELDEAVIETEMVLKVLVA